MHTGSCLCGAVAYAIEKLPGPMVLCHCRTCRKTHGSAFKVGTPVARVAFHWVRGEESLSSYESSPGKQRRFCSICGSHLLSERPDAEHLVLAAGTLDTDPGFGPSAHIWYADRAPWFDWDADLPVHDEGLQRR